MNDIPRGTVLPPDVAHIAFAAAALRNGDLVGMPTETVYGLAANALDAAACARVFEAKRRPSFDPLIVHVLDVAAASTLAAAPLDAVALALARAFWPGPLTLVVPKAPGVPDIVTSGLDSVALRAPAHPVARALIERAGCPVAAPSANLFGAVSPTRAAHVRDSLGDAVACVLDGGDCRVGVESTILSLTGRPAVLRCGGVAIEAIEAVIGAVEVRLHSTDRPEAPGQLSRHYAPSKPLRLVAARDARGDSAAALLVTQGRGPASGTGYGRVVELAADGDLRAAAHGLFAAMRSLGDDPSVARIDALGCDEVGLGRAIMDRLRRAAHP